MELLFYMKLHRRPAENERLGQGRPVRRVNVKELVPHSCGLVGTPFRIQP